MESKLKHLEMIQGIINRMGNSSFLLKGWSVLLVSALIAIAAKESKLIFVYLSLFPAISFWILDGYFLYQERVYRNLYDQVRKTESENVDFSMDTRSFRGMNNATWPRAIAAKTMLIFHGSIFTIILLIALLSGTNILK